jgi:cytoskeletal protein CcmA (bactofilin family)
MIVYGAVNGNLQVTSLHIKASGKIMGEIRTQTLEVENGAVYDGTLSMTQNSKLAQSHAGKPAERKLIEV